MMMTQKRTLQIRKNIFKLLSVSLLSSLLYMSPAYAQGVPDFYKAPAPLEELDQRPIPRIFSSQMSEDEPAALRLDEIYFNLNKALWEYARVDFIHQENLMELMKPYKFQLSRYGAEFRGGLKKAMEDLNANYSNMKKSIDEAEEKYQVIRKSFSEERVKEVDVMWLQQKSVFIERSDKYFKLQSKFLKAYKKLVQFVIDQGGNYYYNPSTGKITFYGVGAYTYFAKALETFSKITREQQTILEDSTYGYSEPDDGLALQ